MLNSKKELYAQRKQKKQSAKEAAAKPRLSTYKVREAEIMKKKVAEDRKNVNASTIADHLMEHGVMKHNERKLIAQNQADMIAYQERAECTFMPKATSSGPQEAIDRSEYLTQQNTGNYRERFVNIENARIDALEANTTLTPKISGFEYKRLFEHITEEEKDYVRKERKYNEHKKQTLLNKIEESIYSGMNSVSYTPNN